MALGINQVAGMAGSFLGLILGGLLAVVHWRAVFFVSVPIGIAGTIWSYLSLHESGTRNPGRFDVWGNVTFAVGLTAVLAGITYGIQPYGDSSTGWTNPAVLAAIIGGALVLVVFGIIELHSAAPMFNLSLFHIRAFTMANIASLLTAIGRGGLQFMLIIWLQGIWLPLHGYSYEQTPLRAGIYMVPITIGFLVAGPLSGILSDRFGARLFATLGLSIVAATFVGLMLLPVDFPYWVFALLTGLSGIGSGMFSSPNRSAIMNSVPARERGSASGMAGTVQNAGNSLSIGVFFSLMIIGLSTSLPHALSSGLSSNGGARLGGRPHRPDPSGELPLRGLPGLQPDRHPAGPQRRPQPGRRQRPGPHRQGVLPAPHGSALPSGPHRGLHRRRHHVGGRRPGLPRPGQPLRA